MTVTCVLLLRNILLLRTKVFAVTCSEGPSNDSMNGLISNRYCMPGWRRPTLYDVKAPLILLMPSALVARL